MILITLIAAAVAETPSAKAGDRFLIVRDRETLGKGPNGSSSSSSDRDAVVETVLAVRPNGVELLYELPTDTPDDERRGQWQLPVRVFRANSGATVLLDRAGLEARVAPWLKSGGLTRAACGRIIFTWNAFRVNCEPGTALSIVAAYRIAPSAITTGSTFEPPLASTPVRLAKQAGAAEGQVYTGVVPVDRDAIREALAKGDVDAGEVLGKPISLSNARRDHRGDEVVGTITVTYRVNAENEVIRREVLTTYTIDRPGKGETAKTISDVLERRRIAPARFSATRAP